MKKWLYKAAASIAGVLFVASAMTLFAPKAVHAVVSALVTVTNTSANPVATGMSTNVGVPVQNLVTLQCGQLDELENPCNSIALIDTRINPDGSLSTFTIPAGQTFVITDVNWNLFNCTPSTYCHVGLFVPVPSFFTFFTALTTGSVADTNGTAIGSDHFTTGIQIRAVPKIGAGGGPSFVTITGYLTQ